jgi:hypothetical protein
MSLSYEEERAFRELHQRLGDVRQRFRRCYIAWHARLYASAAVLVVGASLVLCGVFVWWPLAVVGCSLTFAAALAAGVASGRIGPQWAFRDGRLAWKGLMR